MGSPFNNASGLVQSALADPASTAKTVLSGLERIESLVTNYGPQVASGVGDLADALGGAQPKSGENGSTRSTGAPIANDVASRLHRAADVLGSIFDWIQAETGRAKAAHG